MVNSNHSIKTSYANTLRFVLMALIKTSLT